jgi:hypothetical protein
MITAIVNSLTNHVYALLDMLTGWFTSAPAPMVDGIVGGIALIVLCVALIVATGGDLGSHRRSIRLALTDNAKLSAHAKPRHRSVHDCNDHEPYDKLQPLADDRVVAFVPLDAQEHGVHVGAHERWSPAEEVKATDAPAAQAQAREVEWLAFLSDGRAKHAELTADIQWAELDWTAVNEAMAPAERWHEEHGQHCACCHVGIGVVWAEWRTGENTIEISRDQLAAAGVR